MAFVLAWAGGILFPMRFVTRRDARAAQVFDWAFQTHVSHVLMHAFLYAVLAGLLAARFLRPALSPRRLIVSVLITVAAVAVLQESIQMACGRVRFGSDEVFDLLVNLNGGLLGLMLFLKSRQCRREEQRQLRDEG